MRTALYRRFGRRLVTSSLLSLEEYPTVIVCSEYLEYLQACHKNWSCRIWLTQGFRFVRTILQEWGDLSDRANNVRAVVSRSKKSSACIVGILIAVAIQYSYKTTCMSRWLHTTVKDEEYSKQ